MPLMAESSRGSATALVVLLVLEGLGGLLVALLNVVTSRELGHDFLPWQSSVIPAGFGVLCLLAAFGLMRLGSWGTILAALSQLLVLGAGIYAILDRVRPLAWAVIVLGILGLLLLSRTGRRA
jgi:uncharacterized membrane protein (DUF2068 family)